ncbi:hypothetical protein GCM10023168_24190 [Fodinibacter luteus]|uniref:Glycosyl transferase family 11 n=1 Tax=Fodinibacter luteus TaxID=552064 RepID=A0ABP8KJ65_9MICO
MVRRGSRTVRETPPGLGFGNFLYLWLRADSEQARGHDHRVVRVPGMDPWLDMFPSIRGLLVERRDVRPWDRRDPSWNQRFGVEFTREELQAFIRRHLIGSQLTRLGDADRRSVVVNVRRGDYYSVPRLRGQYSFDIPAFLDVALDASVRGAGPVERIRVVSDDVGWCRERLDGLLRRRAGTVEYQALSSTPQEDFRAVATSPRIIGTNSTFSYWAGYVSSFLHGEQAQVVVPAFHARHVDGGRAYQLDPAWTIVEDIPGGWDA